ARGGEAQAEDDVVEPPLEQLQQRLTSDVLGAVTHLEVAAELPFEHPVDAAELLLLTQLDRVLGELGPRLAVLAGRIVAPLDGALVRVAALSLQEDLQTLAPALAAGGSRITCHVRS